MEIEQNKILKELSWMHIGGKAKYFCQPETIEDLSNLLKQIPKEEKILVIGNMSNVLLSDDGFDGYVIKLNKLNEIKFLGNGIVEVGAGVQNKHLAIKAMEQGLSGYEFLEQIPGTIGGGIKMNAGAFNQSITDIFVSAICVNRKGEILNLSKEDAGFEYRHSNIDDDLIIVSATFKLFKKDKELIKKTMQEIEEKRSGMPKNNTLGSTFKNPEGQVAGKLIEDAGLKGFCVGDACVSDIHANYIINKGNASALDVKKLIAIIQKEVYNKFKINLQKEIQEK